MLKFDDEQKKVVPEGTAMPVKGLEPQKSDYKINRYFFLAIIIIFGLFLYIGLYEFFTAFLGAIIFYILLRRRMDKLIKRGWRRPAAASLVMVISFIIIMVPLVFVAMMLYNKGKYYMANPDLLVASLQKMRLQIQQNYGISFISEEKVANIKTYMSASISKLLNTSVGFFTDIAMLYFFLYFMLINVNRLEAAIVFFLPFSRSKIELFGKELVGHTFSNAVGVPAIALAQGIIGYISYVIVGLPEAGFWAVITAFTSVLPVLGTALVWVPAAAYLFVIKHTWQGGFMVGWGLLVLGMADNVVRFVLAKKMADVHPVITILGVIMGMKFFGLAGIIFGPVLISYFLILLRIYYFEYQTGLPVIKKKKIAVIRFNLPFIGQKTKTKKTVGNAGDRGNEQKPG